MFKMTLNEFINYFNVKSDQLDVVFSGWGCTELKYSQASIQASCDTLPHPLLFAKCSLANL